MEKSRFQSFALIVGSFSLTLALLLGVWMVGFGRQPAPQATPYVAPSMSFAPQSSSTPPPGPFGTPGEPVLTLPPIPTPGMLRTPVPSVAPRASTLPGSTVVYTVNGADYASSDVPGDARISVDGTSLIIQTSRTSPDQAWVTWRLSPEQLGTTAAIHNVDVSVCGQGQGDFWEAYGPDGGNPFEYEVLPPDADGCWHFDGAPGHDLSVVAGTLLDSTMRIDQIDFAVTFAL